MPADRVGLAARQLAAVDTFALADALLEVVTDPQVYEGAARDLALAPGAVAGRVADAPFADLPFGLSYKCDGCLYNEFCLKWAADADDLSLLPFLTDGHEQALIRAGVRTNRDLATLKDFAPPGPGVGKGDLVPAPGRAALAARLAGTWPVGPRVDELVHRARAFRRFGRGDDLVTIPFLPGKGNALSVPPRTEHQPGLVFVDARPTTSDQVYLLAGLVVAHERAASQRAAGGPA